jgi:hypothetical protein
MRNLSPLILVLCIIISFSCQIKSEKDGNTTETTYFTTTVSGYINDASTTPGNIDPALGTIVTVDTVSKTVDGTGYYSITITHNGTFSFNAVYKSGKYACTGKITTKSSTFTRNVTF